MQLVARMGENYIAVSARRPLTTLLRRTRAVASLASATRRFAKCNESRYTAVWYTRLDAFFSRQQQIL